MVLMATRGVSGFCGSTIHRARSSRVGLAAFVAPNVRAIGIARDGRGHVRFSAPRVRGENAAIAQGLVIASVHQAAPGRSWRCSPTSCETDRKLEMSIFFDESARS